MMPATAISVSTYGRAWKRTGHAAEFVPGETPCHGVIGEVAQRIAPTTGLVEILRVKRGFQNAPELQRAD